MQERSNLCESGPCESGGPCKNVNLCECGPCESGP